MSQVFEGRAWVVGDDIGIDSHIMSLRATREKITDPEVLSSMIFGESFPEITGSAAAGDIIVAGRHFAHGTPHVFGWIGMRARGLGVVCSTIGRPAYRNAIDAGTPLLVGETGLAACVRDGQGVVVDFARGHVVLDTGERFTYPPLPPELQEIVRLGGTRAWARHVVAQRAADR